MFSDMQKLIATFRMPPSRPLVVDDAITVQHLERACLLEGLDSTGLDKTEQNYLRLLDENRGKPVRLNVVASILGLPARTIADVTEKFLLREGLIARCDNGRALTDNPKYLIAWFTRCSMPR
jgi:Holliday junction resolvasome RuvABC ATP-dependent DNA helicase subunit